MPPTPPNPGTPAIFSVILFLVLIANTGLAWLLAGTTIWLWVMGIAGGLFAMFVFAVFKDTTQSLGGRGALMMLGLIAYAVVLLGSGFYISFEFARGTVYVDNFSPNDVRLDLNGATWRESRRQSTQVLGLQRGTYTLVIYDLQGGGKLAEHQINVEGRDNYVLNVLGAQAYARGRVDYGGFGFFAPPQPEILRHPWFKANVDYLFQEPPQSITVSVPRGQSAGGASRTYLKRMN
jgi:hypothetical protein